MKTGGSKDQAYEKKRGNPKEGEAPRNLYPSGKKKWAVFKLKTRNGGSKRKCKKNRALGEGEDRAGITNEVRKEKTKRGGGLTGGPKVIMSEQLGVVTTVEEKLKSK